MLFRSRKESVIAKQIIDFFNKYNKTLTPEILAIEVSNAKGVTDKEVGDIGEFINTLKPNPDVNKDWLVENTEKFCKDRAVYLAIMQSIKIFEGKDPIHNQDAIPSLLSDALAVSFDSHIGHDYIEDFAERFEFYHRIEEKIPFDLDMFNKITKGGLSRKTLNIALAGTGVGKSLFMCHVGAAALRDGKNVLYIKIGRAHV